MLLNELKFDITKGYLWKNIKYFLRLGCSIDLISGIVATRYDITTQNAMTICRTEIKKYMSKQVIYTVEKEQKKRKTNERNQLIKFRFYDLYEKERLRVDDVVSKISKEFFLSEIRIVEIIRGAIATGELPISKSSIITQFRAPTRQDKKNKYLNQVVKKLKEEYYDKQTPT